MGRVLPPATDARLRWPIPEMETSTTYAAQPIGDYFDRPAFDLIRHAAGVLPHRDAIVYGEERWTYEHLNHDTVRCAAMLQAFGVRPGDRVGLLLPNVPEFVIAAAGIWRAGAIAVALSPLMTGEEIDKLVRQTGCRYVVTLDMLAHTLADCQDVLNHTFFVSIRRHLPSLKQLGYLWMRSRRNGQWSLPSDATHHWFWESIDSTHREWQPVSISPAVDPAYILPTGGTTGSPKAVTLSHQNMVANAWQQMQWTKPPTIPGSSNPVTNVFGSETMLAVLPFFHSYGVSAIAMGGAAMGATLVLHHRFNVRQVIDLIRKHHVSVFHAVPAMLVALNERLQDHPDDLSSLKWVISGGAPLEASVAGEFARHSGALIVEGFGLSEASPVTHVGPLYEPPRYGKIGLPLPHTKCRIVDQDGGTDDLGNHQVGELIVSGPQVMLGYWADPVATREAIQDGWLRTGDLATRDEDGYYAIVGRKKDLIITSGFNVYPVEVETVLQNAPGVKEVSVIGVPDHQRGELVKAMIVLQDNMAWDEASLRAYCRNHLGKHKRPRLYEQCKDLPKNFLGKVVRRTLREQSGEQS